MWELSFFCRCLLDQGMKKAQGRMPLRLLIHIISAESYLTAKRSINACKSAAAWSTVDCP